MNAQHLEILAACCKKIFEKMTQTKVVSISLENDDRAQVDYPVAKIVSYEDFNSKVKGNIILGFPDEAMAVLVASRIAENMGLPPLFTFDETAADILNEFMNTVVGRTISLWDAHGFKVRFQVPSNIISSNLQEYVYPNSQGYLIMLNLTVSHVIFRVTFCENGERKAPGKRILIVDDSKVIRGVVSKALKEAGYQVEEAANGRSAIDKHQAFQPHLTIMDINMPDLSGLDVIMQIREADPEARFVMLTSSSRKDEVITARNLNVRNYVVKPVEIVSFLQVVQKALE